MGDRWAGGFDRALDALSSRGPDERGCGLEENVRFGHRRLSVIDIEAGQQPMLSADGRYALVYNGEIYNFKEIRRELETVGSGFRTSSDTEVLLEGYARWGRGFRIGSVMFAFVIWDRHEKNDLCRARDRFGIKPLFIQRKRVSSPPRRCSRFSRAGSPPFGLRGVAGIPGGAVDLFRRLSILRDVRPIAAGIVVELGPRQREV
ncbi:MAG: hypothetical protein R3C45_03200 [Phycisphaerales bacterium]